MWKQGEHIVIVGANGSGKTTLARTLLDYRKHRIMLVTKPDDLQWRGWKNITTASGIHPRHLSLRLWPVYEHSTVEFRKAFDSVWNDGHWCLYVDELYHVEHVGLKDRVVKLLTQGRSKRISVVVGVQRPAHVTRFALSEPNHVFAFRMGDRRDLKALSDGISDAFASAVARVEQYEYVYVNKVTGKIVTGNARTLEKVLG